MNRPVIIAFLCLVALWMGSGSLVLGSDDQTAKPSEANKKDAKAPPTHKVKKEPFRISVDLDGVFAAQTAHEIAVRPEEWTSLCVERAADHGAAVRKGDVVLALETEKIDRAIDDLRKELNLSRLAIQQAEDQLQALEKSVPMDLETSRRAARTAEEDRKYFIETERPFAEKIAEFNVKLSELALEYEQEELRQLEKMYKADDITEETEQIVLQRARDSVEKAKFMVEYMKLYRDQTLQFSLPRMETAVKEAAERKALELEKAERTAALGTKKQQLELETLRVQRQRNEERLKKLENDRKLLVVRSPIDGVVYYGKCVRGRFGDSTNLADNLRPRGSILPHQTVMTVGDPRPMRIRAAAKEEQLHWLRPGLQGVAAPTGYPDLNLSAAIDDVADVPTAPGSFDARLHVALDPRSKRLMPGMACKVKLSPYVKKDALCVPPKCVEDDPLDDQKHFVHVLDKDDQPRRIEVTLGQRTDKQVEILSGLAEGDRVLLEAPKDEE